MNARFTPARMRSMQRTILSLLFAGSGGVALADDGTTLTLPPVTIGGGIRTGFIDTQTSGAPDTNDFSVYSARLYINGTVTEQIKFTLDTEYTGDPPNGSNHVQILDAIARFEINPEFNIWAGRFLPPTDRANLYGPYYANNWSVYTDGVQDGYPATYGGRDNGVAYWGDFGNLKLSAGAFDIPGTSNTSKVLTAARLQYDFWDAEPGYYLNGTYYGEKDILALGVAGQNANGHSGETVDFLLEKKVPGDGVVSIEAEGSRYDGLGGYDAAYADSKGWYALAAFLFPQKIGIGKFQLLGKYAEADFSRGALLTDFDYTQKTGELDLNYVMKSFNARASLYLKRTTFDKMYPNSTQIGIGVQLQI